MSNRKTKPKKTSDLQVSTGIKGSLLLLFIVLLASAAGLWFVWTSPARADLADARASLASVTEDNNRIRSKITDLRAGGTSEGEAKFAEALELDEYLPASLDKVELAASIPGLAKKHNVTLSELAPAEEPDSGSLVTTLSFRTGVEGTSANVLAFLDEVSGDSNNIGLLTISNVTTNASSDKFAASFLLHAHAAKEPPLYAKSAGDLPDNSDLPPEPEQPTPPKNDETIDVFGEVEDIEFDD